jgi:hypothetical protein
VARRYFRKFPGEQRPWHFAIDCPDWPISDYDTPTDANAAGPLCDTCQRLERMHARSDLARPTLSASSILELRHAR